MDDMEELDKLFKRIAEIVKSRSKSIESLTKDKVFLREEKQKLELQVKEIRNEMARRQLKYDRIDKALKEVM